MLDWFTDTELGRAGELVLVLVGLIWTNGRTLLILVTWGSDGRKMSETRKVH